MIVDANTCDFEVDSCDWYQADSDSSIKLVRDHGGPGYRFQHLGDRPPYDITLGPQYLFGVYIVFYNLEEVDILATNILRIHFTHFREKPGSKIKYLLLSKH